MSLFRHAAGFVALVLTTLFAGCVSYSSYTPPPTPSGGGGGKMLHGVDHAALVAHVKSDMTVDVDDTQINARQVDPHGREVAGTVVWIADLDGAALDISDARDRDTGVVCNKGKIRCDSDGVCIFVVDTKALCGKDKPAHYHCIYTIGAHKAQGASSAGGADPDISVDNCCP